MKTFVTSCSILLRKRAVSHKTCREYQNAHFTFSNLFFWTENNSWDNVEK